MNKLLIAAAVAGLGSIATAPAVFAQAQSPQMQSPQTQTPQTQAAEKSQEVLPKTFAEADTDKNGELSFKEANVVHDSLSQEQFDMADKDKNGSLSEEESAALDAAPRAGQEEN